MPDSLYETDLLAWSRAQGDRLRRLAAGERVNDLDWAHVIAEIEAVGRSELKAVRAFLALALQHALKIVAWPGHPASDHWRIEVENFITQARHRFEPGMAQHIDLAALHQAAVRALPRLGMATPPGPVAAAPVLDLADLIAEDVTPDDLIDRLRPPAP